MRYSIRITLHWMFMCFIQQLNFKSFCVSYTQDQFDAFFMMQDYVEGWQPYIFNFKLPIKLFHLPSIKKLTLKNNLSSTYSLPIAHSIGKIKKTELYYRAKATSWKYIAHFNTRHYIQFYLYKQVRTARRYMSSITFKTFNMHFTNCAVQVVSSLP